MQKDKEFHDIICMGLAKLNDLDMGKWNKLIRENLRFRRKSDENCLFPTGVKFFVVETDVELGLFTNLYNRVSLGHEFKPIPELNKNCKIINVIGNISLFTCSKPHAILLGTKDNFATIYVNPCTCHDHTECYKAM
jgi:hypothetical protein